MYKSICTDSDRLARIERFDRSLTLLANNRMFISAYANDFVEESSSSVQPGSIHLDMSTETHITSPPHTSPVFLLFLFLSVSFSIYLSATVRVHRYNASNAWRG